MAISIRGNYENPAKSPYSFEKYDSDMERKMMVRLEENPEVAKWQKRHTVTIPWIDRQGKRRNYRPDFIVEYADGRKAMVEVKDPSRVDSPAVQRKANAAREWCRKRGMEYEISYISA